MPLTPFRACPRCGQKFRGPSCRACGPRPSSFVRSTEDYPIRWKRHSIDFRARFPFCGLRSDNAFHPEHSDCARLGRKVLANLVDHIRPVELGGDMYDESNHQSLCFRCHSRKSRSEVGSNGRVPLSNESALQGRGRRVVVTGPPSSGKTSFVDANRRPGDLVWDLDALASVIALMPDYPRPALVVDALSQLRAAFVRFLVERPQVSCFVIVADEDDGVRLATLLGATLQRCRTPVHSSPPLSTR